MTMPPTKIVIDCSTGKATERALTTAEVAQLEQERAEAAAAAAVPDPPTDVERLAAVLVSKVDALTEADVAEALGVHEDRVAAATAELTKKPAPTKGKTR